MRLEGADDYLPKSCLSWLNWVARVGSLASRQSKSKRVEGWNSIYHIAYSVAQPALDLTHRHLSSDFRVFCALPFGSDRTMLIAVYL